VPDALISFSPALLLAIINRYGFLLRKCRSETTVKKGTRYAIAKRAPARGTSNNETKLNDLKT
jgi:hypothetical protein